MWTISFTENYGFVGIFLLASWPNAAFDMCGMACGWLQMPFWTFFGAVLLGKGFAKVTLQIMGCTVVFGKSAFAVIKTGLRRIDVFGIGLEQRVAALRKQVMSQFEAQARLTCAGLLGDAESLDERGLAAKYCAVADQCAKTGCAAAASAAASAFSSRSSSSPPRLPAVGPCQLMSRMAAVVGH